MQLREKLLGGGIALVAALTLALPVSALAAEVAKIGDVSYETLDAAVEAVTADQQIDLVSDAELTVGSIKNPVTINGNGHTVSVPTQSTEDGGLALTSTLTFKKANVSVVSDDYGFTLQGEGKLVLVEGSDCQVKGGSRGGVYMNPGTSIKVDASSLSISNCGSTGLMGEGSVSLEATNGSTVTASNNATGDGETANGISGVKLSVKDSKLVVEGNENQGLVKAPLSLDNSTAFISRNDIGITEYENTDYLVMENGSKLTMADNKGAGIFMYAGTVNVEKGCELSITGTGNGSSYDRSVSRYSYCGALVLRGRRPAEVTFSDDAKVTIVNNPLGGISNRGGNGFVTLGANTVVTNNGGERVPNGGGIFNNGGTVTVAEGAQVYNNHAKTSGDDVANLNGGSLTLAATGSDWQLDDCDHAITGWFDDAEAARWNAHDKDADVHVVEVAAAIFTDDVYLKAAHGLATVDYKWVSTESPSGVNPPAADQNLEFGSAYTAKAQDKAAGWTFDGWYVDEACTTKWADGAALPGSMTLYGKWTKDAQPTPTPSPDPTPKAPEQAATKTVKKTVPKTGDPASIAGIAVAAVAGGSALLAAKKMRRK